MFNVETRNFEQILEYEIPKAMAAKYTEYSELTKAIIRFSWRKNYELMIPVISLG